MVARVIQFPSYKLWFPKKPSQKLYQKCHEPSRTLELILPKPLTELRCEVREEGPLAQNHTVSLLVHSQISTSKVSLSP